jgi:hypothetical protein
MARLGDEIMLLEGLGDDVSSDFAAELEQVIIDLKADLGRGVPGGPRGAAIHSLHREQLAAALDYSKAVAQNDLVAARHFFDVFAAAGQRAQALSGNPVQAGVGGFFDDVWSYIKDTGESAGNSITAKIKGDVIEELGGSRPSGSNGVTVTTTPDPSSLPPDFYTNPIYGVAKSPEAGSSFLSSLPSWAPYAGAAVLVLVVGAVAWKSM